MPEKVKEKKCKNRRCRKLFEPSTKWHEFCSISCRSATAYRRRAAVLKEAQRIIGEQGAA